jgi:hypothetical protein
VILVANQKGQDEDPGQSVKHRPDEDRTMLSPGPDPMARPTPADLLVLADIAEILDDPGLAARWRWQARQAMKPASLRADLNADPATASALIADLSAQTGSLEKAYTLLGPDPAPPPADGSEQVAMLDALRDPRQWTR